MSAVPGVGAVIGSLMVAVIGARARRGRLLFLGAGSAAASLIAFTFAPSLVVALPFLAAIGVSNAFFMTMNSTIVLQRAPAELRGRVVSAMIVVWGLSPIGSTLMGLVASAAGVRVSLAIFGAAALAVAAIVFVRRPSLRAL